MNRDNFVLSVLSCNNCKNWLCMAKIQRLFFLIDSKIPELINGPIFEYYPLDYGPSSSELHNILNNLVKKDLIFRKNDERLYQLTFHGQNRGLENFREFSENAADFIKTTCSFISILSFEQLFSIMKEQYPHIILGHEEST